MAKNEDRLSILEKIERGEISIDEAEGVLKQTLEKTDEPAGEKKAKPIVSEATAFASAAPTSFVSSETDIEKDEMATAEGEACVFHCPTRRERKLELAEKFQDWRPHMMVGLEGSGGVCQWPWEDKGWQWMWQNFDYPVYMSHSIDAKEGGELQVVAYQGDLFIRGWDEPTLRINGAVFDIRIGQDDNVTRVASSTGQLQIWVPNSIARVDAKVKPGDVWFSNVSADVEIYCESGDLGCEKINGNVKAQINGGDTRLMGIEGIIDVNVVRGNGEVRDIISDDVTLRATEGNLWLNLNSVNSGRFRCENKRGDINLLINGELACELLVEATEGGRIYPVTLPWQQLLERSEGKLHGILKGGGASISLITQGGKIYIQESWINTSRMSLPS